MAFKLFITLLFTLNLFNGIYLFPTVDKSEVCSTEDKQEIIDENLALLDQLILNSTLYIQELVEIPSSDKQSNEYFQLLKEINTIKEYLNNLKSNLCTNESKTEFDIKISKIDVQQLKCSTNTDKKGIELNNKAESVIKKIQSLKTKSSSLLQKCNSLKISGECPVILACCEHTISQLSSKIESSVSKIQNVIKDEQDDANDCLKKVAKDALKIETGIKEELLECRLQELGNDSEISNESSQSGENTHEEESISEEEWNGESNEESLPPNAESPVDSENNEEEKPLQPENPENAQTESTETAENAVPEQPENNENQNPPEPETSDNTAATTNKPTEVISQEETQHNEEQTPPLENSNNSEIDSNIDDNKEETQHNEEQNPQPENSNNSEIGSNIDNNKQAENEVPHPENSSNSETEVTVNTENNSYPGVSEPQPPKDDSNVDNGETNNNDGNIPPQKDNTNSAPSETSEHNSNNEVVDPPKESNTQVDVQLPESSNNFEDTHTENEQETQINNNEENAHPQEGINLEGGGINESNINTPPEDNPIKDENAPEFDKQNHDITADVEDEEQKQNEAQSAALELADDCTEKIVDQIGKEA